MSYDAHYNYTPPPKREHGHRARWIIGLASLGACAALIGATVALGHGSPTSASTSPSASTSAPAHATPTAEQIAKLMHLPAPVFGYTATTDENHLLGRPGQYTSKVNWGAPTSDDSDNSIEVFPTSADAATRAGYLAAFKPPFGDGYDHQNGAALLRLSADVTPAQARVLIAEFDKAVS